MKHLILAPALAVALAACSTTVGASGETADLAPLLVANQPGDGEMSCEQISAEIDKMNLLIVEAEQASANAEASGAAAGAASGAAVNAALYSGALGRVPGLGFAANAAGGLAQQQAKAQAERQAENARRAELRRTALTGISAGKGC